MASALALTGSTDSELQHEIRMMWQALRRTIPQPIRQQARLEYRLHYLFNMASAVPQTMRDYSWTLYNTAMAWYYTEEKPRIASEYHYIAVRAAITTARHSLNITAYQAGCFSARWGLFLNAVSKVGSRALLSYYEWCENHTYSYGAPVDVSLAHTLKHMTCALWLRARCIYLYAKLLFSWLMYKQEKKMGHSLTSWQWNETWRQSCCEILQAKIDIAGHETAMATSGVPQTILFTISATVRRLVEGRLLRGPFPRGPQKSNLRHPHSSPKSTLS